MTIQKIRDLITDAKVDRALKALAKHPAVLADTDIKTVVGSIQAQYKTNERSKLMGSISNDNYRVEYNRINSSLFMLLIDLESEESDVLTPVNDIPANPDPIVVDPVKPEIISDDQKDDGITKIIFLASNPSDTAELQLTKEHSRISEKLQNADHPERFPIRPFRAVTAFEFNEHIFNERPNIVHFSGHGDSTKPDVKEAVSNGMGRPKTIKSNPEEESGIFLWDEDKRKSRFVNTVFLKRTFKSMVQRHDIPIKVVIFNACHSSVQAEAVSKVVPYVVGTSWTVKDEAAIAFATGFYFGITEDMSIEDAVDNGITYASVYNEPEDRFLLYKDGKKMEW